jgi:hypothetical protein
VVAWWVTEQGREAKRRVYARGGTRAGTFSTVIDLVSNGGATGFGPTCKPLLDQFYFLYLSGTQN